VSSEEIKQLADQVRAVDKQISHLDAQMTPMIQAIKDMASSIRKLSDAEIRREERESRQDAVNRSFGTRIEALERYRHALEIERAEEKPARTILKKYYWVLLLAGLITTAVVAEYAKDFLKNIIG